MELEHSFTVPVGIGDAWLVLMDIERIAPCMPGAAIDSVDGDDFTGTVKVKLGPIGLTYKGKASFVEKDEVAHRAVIDARGRDARGNGTANARVTATLAEVDGSTQVHVLTALDITGKPAQFGRGVMADVGNKLIGQFASCLATKLTDAPAAESSESGEAESGEADSGGADSGGAESRDVGGEARHAAFAATASGEVTVPAEAAPVATSRAGAGSVDGSVPAESTAPRPARPAIRAVEPEPIDLIGSAGPAIAKRVVPVVVVLGLLVAIVWRIAARQARRQA